MSSLKLNVMMMNHQQEVTDDEDEDNQEEESDEDIKDGGKKQADEVPVLPVVTHLGRMVKPNRKYCCMVKLGGN